MTKHNFSRLMGSDFGKSNRNPKMDDSLIKAAIHQEFNPEDPSVNVDPKFLQKTMSGKFQLRQDIRKFAFKHIKEHKIAKNLLKELPEDNVYGKVVLSILGGEEQDLMQKSFKELQSTFQVVMALPEEVSNAPKLHDIEGEMSRREFLVPLQRLTENFEGRKDELSKIKDYVDWLPKDTLIQNARSLFRDLIGWHIKPPLLITGIGGIGKSTLIAKFILDHVTNMRQKDRKLPFVYIDFDLAGLSIKEPLYVIIESLRQITLQFPERTKLLNTASELVSHYIGKNIPGKSLSTSYEREELIGQLVKKYDEELAKLDTPVLIVLDSFEELQYKATKSEFRNFMDLIKKASENMPRIRLVFVGRGGIDIEEIKFDNLELSTFDRNSANGYLKSLGIEDDRLRSTIINKFGGNPLTLQLAASLANVESINSIEELRTHSFLVRMDEDQIQQILVERNLNHIHDPKIRTLAMPGILVRKLNPKVIQEVLAGPCGLGKISEKEAEHYFEEIKRETFLIQNYNDDQKLSIRQDLRQSMLKFVWKKDPKGSKEIHLNAIRFYQGKANPENLAEWVYHKIQAGDSISFLNSDLYQKVRPYLEPSLSEFDIDTRVHIAKLQSTSLSEQVLKKASQDEWESYYIQIVQDSLNGELIDLEQVASELKKRKERSYCSDLLFYEAELLTRLGKQSEGLTKLETAFQEKVEVENEPSSFSLRYKLLRLRSHEYLHKNQTDFKKFVLRRAYDDLRSLTSFETTFDKLQLLYTTLRAEGRINGYLSDRLRTEFVSQAKKLRNSQDYTPLGSYSKLILNHEVIDCIEMTINPFLSFSGFINERKKFEHECSSIHDLDRFLINRASVKLKEIANAGVLDVSIVDAIHHLELMRIGGHWIDNFGQ